jgi:hypothetical protein
MNEFAIRIRTRWLLIGAGGLVLAVALAAGVIWYLKSHDAFGIPRAVRQEAAFPVYYVRNIPEPYRVQDKSYSYNKGMLSFVIEGENDREVLVTEQSPPKNFDIDAFVDKELTDQKAVTTVYGKAIMGKRQSTRVVSLKTGDTWVMLSASDSVPAEDLELLTDRLQLQK